MSIARIDRRSIIVLALKDRVEMQPILDRAHEDVGNIVHFEHVNVKQPDQQLATAFYVPALGLTRDPFMMVGLDNMWINVGRNQFHLPTGDPQRLRGVIGVVVPDPNALRERLREAAPLLSGTSFGFVEHGSFIEVTCPKSRALGEIDSAATHPHRISGRRSSGSHMLNSRSRPVLRLASHVSIARS